jgi:hypothetical protein
LQECVRTQIGESNPGPHLTFIVWPPDFDYAKSQAHVGDVSPRDFQSEVALFNIVHLPMTYDERIVLMVIVIGALGSYIHAATSFADYIGNRRLVNSGCFGI